MFPKTLKCQLDNVYNKLDLLLVGPQQGFSCNKVQITQKLKLKQKQTILEQIIFRNGVNWSPRSCDLRPLDNFL